MYSVNLICAYFEGQLFMRLFYPDIVRDMV